MIKSDGKIVKAELEYVKKFFVNTFGVQKANKYKAESYSLYLKVSECREQLMSDR